MTENLKKTVLSNGRTVYCHNDTEAALVQDQVQLYFNYGVTLNPGDTVFDVGANIGLFSLKCQELTSNNARVFAFEPIPATYQILKANAESVNPEMITTFNCGLSDTSGSTVFAYNPHHTTLSSAFIDAQSTEEMREQLKTAVLHNFDEIPQEVFDSRLLFRVLTRLPLFARKILVDWATRQSFKDVEHLTCELRTVSEIIKEFDIDKVDLLKVDVEKSELDVLHGIEDQDWPKIQQIVLEIHDLEGRLETIKSILKKHGLDKITVEQEPTLIDTNVYSLYAIRQSGV